MIMDVSLVSADITWLQKEIVSPSLQDVSDMRKEFVKIVFHTTSSKEEFAKFKDVLNIQETTAKDAEISTI